MLVNNYSVIFAIGKTSDNIVNIILDSEKFFEGSFRTAILLPILETHTFNMFGSIPLNDRLHGAVNAYKAIQNKKQATDWNPELFWNINIYMANQVVSIAPLM